MSGSDNNAPPPNPAQREQGREHLGIAGAIARAFIHSPLAPLLFLTMLVLGVIGLIQTPRQEDPQISVPMVDILFEYPGASSEQVAKLAVDPLQRLISEIPGVEHVYGVAERGQGMVTVQFEVGQPYDSSVDKVRSKVSANWDKIPPGVGRPLVRAKGIDDVPVITLTLWSHNYDDVTLRALAMELRQKLKNISDTGNSFVVGGRREQIRVDVSPQKLASYGISLDQLAQEIRAANAEDSAGAIETGGQSFTVYTGSFLRTAEDIGNLKIGSFGQQVISVADVASVSQRPEDPQSLVTHYTGSAYQGGAKSDGAAAVTIAIAKKVGSNGVTVANAVKERIEQLKRSDIPRDVHVETTRDYGKTASDKVNGLMIKLVIATLAVTLLILLTLGPRPAIVVTLVIPVVLLVTVFMAFVMGYTIDRVSLFALIFAIGILVDDAIVVIENIYRRWLMVGKMETDTAVDAVREVGNPTILATFTVIAALLPMGFVSGMMGPYMEPIPALGSVAMLFSLVAAFAFTPFLAMRIKPSMAQLKNQERREERDHAFISKIFKRTLVPLIENRATGRIFLVSLIGIFALSMTLLYPAKLVPVKMLPYDNKPEFSVVIDMPEGTALPVTANLTHRVAERLRKSVPEILSIQTYVGTAKPFDFNGMVRHYYLREKPWHAEVQVLLVDKANRSRSSHEIAVQARTVLAEIRQQFGQNKQTGPQFGLPREEPKPSLTVVEMPPGPPVLQSVVAEVYGPDMATRHQVATALTGAFKQTEKLTDVDNYIPEPYEVWQFEVDTEKAVRRGISVKTINRNMSMALGGFRLGDVKRGGGLEPTYIVMQIPLAVRSRVSQILDMPITAADGSSVPLGELGRMARRNQDPVFYFKDLRPVEYVVADVSGRLAAPIYGMTDVEEILTTINDGQPFVAADGTTLTNGTMTGPPPNNGKAGFEWAGEWTVTYETFRDMGIAFAAALLLIYILVVWEFGNFTVPLVIMAPIPLTLIGIVPGHLLMLGAEFTATSMIGFIALAGIIVRNSILLVDFTVHSVRAGMSVPDAVVHACEARTRPIGITALALVAGSSVIIFDPIFQGMAISLLFGAIVSTVLTLIVIPLGCISAKSSILALAGNAAGELPHTDPDGPNGGPGGGPGGADRGPLSSFQDYCYETLLMRLGGAMREVRNRSSAAAEAISNTLKARRAANDDSATSENDQSGSRVAPPSEAETPTSAGAAPLTTTSAAPLAAASRLERAQTPPTVKPVAESDTAVRARGDASNPPPTEGRTVLRRKPALRVAHPDSATTAVADPIRDGLPGSDKPAPKRTVTARNTTPKPADRIALKSPGASAESQPASDKTRSLPEESLAANSARSVVRASSNTAGPESKPRRKLRTDFIQRDGLESARDSADDTNTAATRSEQPAQRFEERSAGELSGNTQATPTESTATDTLAAPPSEPKTDQPGRPSDTAGSTTPTFSESAAGSDQQAAPETPPEQEAEAGSETDHEPGEARAVTGAKPGRSPKGRRRRGIRLKH